MSAGDELQENQVSLSFWTTWRDRRVFLSLSLVFSCRVKRLMASVCSGIENQNSYPVGSRIPVFDSFCNRCQSQQAYLNFRSGNWSPEHELHSLPTRDVLLMRLQRNHWCWWPEQAAILTLTGVRITIHLRKVFGQSSYRKAHIESQFDARWRNRNG